MPPWRQVDRLAPHLAQLAAGPGASVPLLLATANAILGAEEGQQQEALRWLLLAALARRMTAGGVLGTADAVTTAQQLSPELMADLLGLLATGPRDQQVKQQVWGSDKRYQGVLAR